jgi:succinyl-CoA---D-citramalate CoA-transferase
LRSSGASTWLWPTLRRAVISSGNSMPRSRYHSARGQTILKELVPKADMLLQNFSPGVMDAMGLGYDVLKELNPGIIMINVSGFGQYGPYRNRRAFDPIGQAMAGVMFDTAPKTSRRCAAGHR